jgi:PAS domain S-box-containing protein
MISKVLNRLGKINPWHFLWISILISIILGLIFNTIQSYLWWGFLSGDLLLIGVIDGFFVPLLVAPVIIYFVRRNAELEKLTKDLQITILKVKESEGKKLRESQALYRSIVEDQSEFINRFLPDFTVLFVNEAACRYFNMSRDEFVGRNFLYLLPPEDQIRLKELLFSLTPENPSAEIEHRVIAPDGSICWQKWTNRALFDGNGNLVQFQAVGRDITRIKQTEVALRESEEMYRILFENATIGIGNAELDGTLIAYNAAILAPGGYTREDIAKIKNMSELYFDIAERDKIIDIARRQGFLDQYPVKFRRKNGTPYDSLLSLRFVKYKGRTCTQAMVEDVTEKRKAEEALQKSEKRYRELFEDSPISIMEMNMSGIKKYLDSLRARGITDFRKFFGNNIEAVRECMALIKVLDMNRATLDLFNAETGQELTENFNKIFDPDSFNFLKDDLVALAEGRRLHEHESVGRTLKGEKIYVFLKWQLVPGFEETLSRLIVSLIDMTRSKELENSLKESEARLRKLSDNLPYGLVYQIDSGEDGHQRRFSYISAGVEQLHGITVTEAMKDAMTIYGQIIEEDRQRLAEEEAFALANMLPFKIEARVQLPSGEIRWRFFSSAPRRFTDNHLLWDGVEIDITERKQLEHSLRESEDRFRIALSNSPIVIFNQDKNLRYTWVYNPRGFSADDVIGKTDSDFYDIESVDHLIEIKRRVLESGTAIKKEVRLKRGNETFYYDCMFEPLYDSDGNIKGINGVAIDVTKRKEDEELIRSYQHQLGRLISQLTTVEERSKRNIAVDLHDNIGQTLACANMMLGELHKSSAGDISKTIDEVRRLIEEIIRYTRSLTFELGNPLLYEIGLEVALERLGKDFQNKHGLKFSFEDDKQPKPLKDNISILLFQSVRELTTNVVKHARAQSLTISLARKDNMIEISVKDDGTGFVAADIKEEFITKSGFGIFSIRERMKHIGGSISISSEPGARTKVTLTAPLNTG